MLLKRILPVLCFYARSLHDARLTYGKSVIRLSVCVSVCLYVCVSHTGITYHKAFLPLGKPITLFFSKPKWRYNYTEFRQQAHIDG